MRNFNEDKYQSTGMIFFIILFSLFIFIFSGRSNNKFPEASCYYYNGETPSGNLTSHSDAVVFNAGSLPDLYGKSVSDVHRSNSDLFPIRYIISDYNNRIAQRLINIQRNSLVIEPILLKRLYNPFHSDEQEPFPVLS
jgi:hypothetical protein